MKKQKLLKLTSRELEIYQLLVTKTSYADISKQLDITVGTVKQHVHSIYTKLEIKKRDSLM